MTGYAAAVTGWAAHLRAGGTTPWLEWSPVGATAPSTEPLPGAAQLEAVRRAALCGGSGRRLEIVADTVLGRSGPGRGLAQQPLLWPGGSRAGGAPPVDPAQVPVEELVRVTVGAVAELLLALPPRAPEPPAPRLVVEGAPLTAARVRRELAPRRWPRSHRRAVVLALPLSEALAEVWSARVQGGAAVRWPGFARRWAGRGELPPSADVVALARDWSARLGPDRVDVLVVAGPGSTVDAAGLLGARRARGASVPADPRGLSPEATDVLRRVNAVLSVRADADLRHRAARTLAAYLEEAGGPRTPLRLPARSVDRIQRLADEQVSALAADAAAGVYRVHGPVTDLARTTTAGRSRPRPAQVLDVALATALALAGTREEGR